MPIDGYPIAAIATAPGPGAIGIIRISGTDLDSIVGPLLTDYPAPRQATVKTLHNAADEALDEALVLYFPAPDSYTGEHMLEIQAHGNPLVLDQLLERICELGARLAQPGEFTQRAFLNGKIDLAQAEAVADLISASSAAAIRGAMRSLQGAFSRRVEHLTEQLTAIRVQLEGSLDFPAEELDTADTGGIAEATDLLLRLLLPILHSADSSLVLGEGLEVTLAGRPNTGKSSLFNALAGRDLAIVSEQAGTTRDVLHCRLTLAGASLELTDTAGLRDGSDDAAGAIERHGMERTLARARQADLILLVGDVNNPDLPNSEPWRESGGKVLAVINKTDLRGADWRAPKGTIGVSAQTGAGLEELKRHMMRAVGAADGGADGMGGANGEGEGENMVRAESDFLARRRHLQGLKQAVHCLQEALQALAIPAPELAAEHLRDAQTALGTLTGTVSSDDLLGNIFATFCIGK